MAGWLINKFFPGREQLKWKMAALFEGGLIVKMKKDTFYKYKERNPIVYKWKMEKQTMELKLEDVQGIFGLLLLGYFLAFASFIIEILM